MKKYVHIIMMFNIGLVHGVSFNTTLDHMARTIHSRIVWENTLPESRGPVGDILKRCHVMTTIMGHTLTNRFVRTVEELRETYVYVRVLNKKCGVGDVERVVEQLSPQSCQVVYRALECMHPAASTCPKMRVVRLKAMEYTRGVVGPTSVWPGRPSVWCSTHQQPRAPRRLDVEKVPLHNYIRGAFLQRCFVSQWLKGRQAMESIIEKSHHEGVLHPLAVFGGMADHKDFTRHHLTQHVVARDAPAWLEYVVFGYGYNVAGFFDKAIPHDCSKDFLHEAFAARVDLNALADPQCTNCQELLPTLRHVFFNALQGHADQWPEVVCVMTQKGQRAEVFDGAWSHTGVRGVDPVWTFYQDMTTDGHQQLEFLWEELLRIQKREKNWMERTRCDDLYEAVHKEFHNAATRAGDAFNVDKVDARVRVLSQISRLRCVLLWRACNDNNMHVMQMIVPYCRTEEIQQVQLFLSIKSEESALRLRNHTPHVPVMYKEDLATKRLVFWSLDLLQFGLKDFL